MFSQLTRYASELDVQIDEANMDIRITYDTRGKLLLEDVSPAAEGVDGDGLHAFSSTKPKEGEHLLTSAPVRW